MQIQVLNPNTSAAMTRQIDAAARAAASAQTQIVTSGSTDGPASIECAHDAALAVPWLLRAVVEGERAGADATADAHLIACFGDPGLAAAREVARAPVIGIAEAALKAASLIAARFSVVTTLARSIGSAERLVRDYGVAHLCARVRAVDLPVLAFEAHDETLHQRLLDECRRALAEDRAEAIVLGCAGMAETRARLSSELGVAVIDGVAAGVRLAEALVGLKLRTSKRGDYAPPPAKPFAGSAAAFAYQQE